MDTTRYKLTFASTFDPAVRRREVVEAVSLDVAANDAIEAEDGDWSLVAVEQTDVFEAPSTRLLGEVS